MGQIQQWLDHLYQQRVIFKLESFDCKQLETLLGQFPLANQMDSVTCVETLEHEHYSQKLWHIPTVEGLVMPTYQLIPTDPLPNRPVVMAIPGHGHGHRQLVGISANNTKLTRADIYHHIAITLAKKGCQVYVPELIGMGRRRLSADQQTDPNANDCYELSSQLLLLGKTLTGLRVAECHALVHYIEQTTGAEQNIGLFGFSGGGLIALLTAILNQHIHATVISGFISYFKDSVMSRRHCLDNYLPGLLHYGEIPELATLIAPRPLFIEAGIKDHLFPIESAKRAIKQIEQHYLQINKAECFDKDIFDGGHEIAGHHSSDWLIKQLTKEEVE